MLESTTVCPGVVDGMYIYFICCTDVRSKDLFSHIVISVCNGMHYLASFLNILRAYQTQGARTVLTLIRLLFRHLCGIGFSAELSRSVNI